MPESIRSLLETVSAVMSEWGTLRLAELSFRHRDAAALTLIVLVSVIAIGLAVRFVLPQKPGAGRLALPALPNGRRSWASGLRHIPLLLFLLGLPFFFAAVADPHTPLSQTEVSSPGRRIALLIDASSSMMSRFPADDLNSEAPTEAAFFTTVAAAERFVHLRMEGGYRDVIALVEFADEAYVITPFTNDYQNILLSLSLIGDWTEFMQFPDQGTTIGLAIEQSVNLFEAFDFLDASGNLMVIFSDGRDADVTVSGQRVRDVLASATQVGVPVFFIRTSYNRSLGEAVPDGIWKSAIEGTGGRFYAASDEGEILRAIREIDELSAGTIEMRQYTAQQPQFGPFALVAVGLWGVALLAKLSVPHFQSFP